jgi:hypothetical protein
MTGPSAASSVMAMVGRSNLRDIVGGDVSLVGFREDLPGKFDPRVGGICLWRREESAGLRKTYAEP